MVSKKSGSASSTKPMILPQLQRKQCLPPKSRTPKEVAIRNFFAPLRTSMNTDNAGAEAAMLEKTVPGKAGRPPPIIT
jgi:hypothetical protein